jgi:pimeloyl-ACP methyl ester carboxylesterase
MPDSELRALGGLAAEYADKALTSTVQGVHTAVSGRAFDAVGVGSSAARIAHDRVSDGVYGALRLGGQGIGMAIAGASQFVGGQEERSTVSSSRFGRATQAAINGLIGDRLEDEENALRIRMALRLPGRDVEPDRESLEAAFDVPTDRLVVFAHGLCETEEAWWLGTRADPAADAPAPATYGARLRDDLGFSPLYLRYNSGLHVSENGRRLSWLLEDLCREWPLQVREVALVGHSMGGLVGRSACHEAAEAERAWIRRTSHVVCLGAPNTGSWLEKFVNVGGWALRNVPESRPLADFLELRSAGIKDLRFGYLRDEDWLEHDPDERLRNRSAPLAPVPGIAYHFVSGGLTANERHPVASVFGDVLVRRHSATGPLTADGGPAGDAQHVQGASHFHLLNHPRVYEHIREWLASKPAAGASVSFGA